MLNDVSTIHIKEGTVVSFQVVGINQNSIYLIEYAYLTVEIFN